MSDRPFKKIAIGGVGLMGGSLGLALQSRNLADSVCGFGRNAERLNQALDAGVVTEVATDIAKAASKAEIVVICLPVGLIPETAAQIAQFAPPGAVLTDVGSTKAELIAKIESELGEGDPAFVGSHPMCGSEKSGFETASADLYEGATCVVTPTLTTPQQALRKVSDLWKGVGGKVLYLDPQMHDRLAARTSHLPRVVAAALCHALDREMDAENRDRMVATGFLGATRTAAGDGDLWTQILSTNREYVLDALGDFQGTLHALRGILTDGDPKRLKDWLDEGTTIRRRFDNAQDRGGE
jgi:prephenate dehydrogenase